jgi:hypothetical protein
VHKESARFAYVNTCDSIDAGDIPVGPKRILWGIFGWMLAPLVLASRSRSSLLTLSFSGKTGPLTLSVAPAVLVHHRATSDELGLGSLRGSWGWPAAKLQSLDTLLQNLVHAFGIKPLNKYLAGACQTDL